jgi:hypothetical protein
MLARFFVFPGRLRFPAFGLIVGSSLAAWLLPACGIAQGESADSGIAAYAREIGEAQAELNDGKVPQARKRLDATDKALRGFEFDYLWARAEQASADAPAPDLIEQVAKSEVETRYGVLNEVNRQLAFICRDGSLRIHDLAALDSPPKTVAHAEAVAVWTGVFSRDGRWFLSGHENGEVLVWDAATWELQRTIPVGTHGPVRALAVAPDGTAAIPSDRHSRRWSPEMTMLIGLSGAIGLFPGNPMADGH